MGRPQNDGPALRGLTLIKIYNLLKDNYPSLCNTIIELLERDLEYVLKNYDHSCFDLWEEINGYHLYTRMVQCKFLKEVKIKSITLPVSAPFHCSLMDKATAVMSKELQRVNFIDSKNLLISNVTAQEISNKEELKNLLIKQIESRVRWRESIINMIENGINHFIEIGPGKVLSGLIKRINKEVKINTINSENDIKDLKI